MTIWICCTNILVFWLLISPTYEICPKSLINGFEADNISSRLQKKYQTLTVLLLLLHRSMPGCDSLFYGYRFYDYCFRVTVL